MDLIYDRELYLSVVRLYVSVVIVVSSDHVKDYIDKGLFDTEQSKS